MKKKLYSLLLTWLIAMLAISPVYASGVSGRIGLGSITFDGTAWGFGSDVTITLSGSGIPLIACGTPGNENQAPGQNPSRVTASDSATDNDDPLKVKGKFNFALAAEVDLSGFSAVDLGCPNNKWIPTLVFVSWDTATVTVTSNKTGKSLYQKTSSCTTVYIPNYTPGDGNTLNDGTISCPGFE